MLRERYVCVPGERCVACDGCGFGCYFDPDSGWEFNPCFACDGVATRGAFVLQVHADLVRHEPSWQTTDLTVALARGERWADLLRIFAGPHARRCEVQVIYKAARESDVVVFIIPVFTRQLAA